MEQITFRGSVEGKASGEPLSQVDFDFSEAWPEVTRQRISLATTTETTVNLGGITTAKIIGIKAETEFELRTNETASGTAVTCRGVAIAQVSSQTVTIKPAVNTRQDIYVFIAGI